MMRWIAAMPDWLGDIVWRAMGIIITTLLVLLVAVFGVLVIVGIAGATVELNPAWLWLSLFALALFALALSAIPAFYDWWF